MSEDGAAGGRKMPDIYTFTLVRPFLRAWRALDRRRSFPWMADARRLDAPQTLVFKMFEVREGFKPARIAARVDAFVAMLRLDTDEATYFRLLLTGEEGAAESDRVRALADAARIRRLRGARTPEANDLPILEDWYYHAIHALVQLPGARMDPVWIAAQLRPAVAPEDVQRAIDFLLERKHLIEQDGRLVAPNPVLVIRPTQNLDAYRDAMRAWHAWFIRRGPAAMAEFTPAERDFGALTVAVPAARYAEAVKLIRDCHERVLGLCEQDGAEAERVYVLNPRFFPVSATVKPAGTSRPKGDST